MNTGITLKELGSLGKFALEMRGSAPCLIDYKALSALILNAVPEFADLLELTALSEPSTAADFDLLLHDLKSTLEGHNTLLDCCCDLTSERFYLSHATQLDSCLSALTASGFLKESCGLVGSRRLGYIARADIQARSHAYRIFARRVYVLYVLCALGSLPLESLKGAVRAYRIDDSESKTFASRLKNFFKKGGKTAFPEGEAA